MTSSPTSSSSSSRTRTSWVQLVFFTVLVYILLFSTACCHAVPVWKTPSTSLTTGELGDDTAAAGLMGEGALDSPDSILERCLGSADGEAVEENVFVKTLCTLAMMHSRNTQHGQTTHQGFAKRDTADRTSWSTFSRVVHRLKQHANEVADYRYKLNRLQSLGMLDSDYNIISVPPEMTSLMQQIG